MGKLNYGEPFTDINCQNLGLDLCERCAGNISMEMYKRRMELIVAATKDRRKLL